MGKNQIRFIAVFIVLLVLSFFMGGWFFSKIGTGKSSGEVLQLYSKDGESLGIFDKIPQEDLEAAAKVAEEGLHTDIILPEDQARFVQDGRALPSQLMVTDMAEIAGVAPRAKKEDSAEDKNKAPVSELDLTGHEVASVAPTNLPALEDGEDTKISLIAAPVRYFIIRNTEEYKEFKRRARGSYPTVDFDKQMLVVLESDSNLPDNVFELVSAENKEGELVVSYRVNVFRLDKKINSHTVLPVDKTQDNVQLKQVL